MENNFEQHIGDSMNNPPEFPFEESLWEDMESRLDRENPSKPTFLGLLGRLPLLLLALFMTGLAGMFYIQQNKAMEKIADLEQQFRAQLVSSTDSAIERHVTVVYDTIYNRVIINQKPRGDLNTSSKVENLNLLYNAPLVFSKRLPAFEPIAFSRPFNFDSTPGIYFSLSPESDSETLTGKSKTTDSEEARNVFEFTSPLKDLPALDYTFLKKPPFADLSMVPIEQRRQKKRLAFYLKKVKPTEVLLVGTTGTFVSLNLGGNGFNLKGSAHAELGLGERLRWTMGVEYFSNDFNIRIDENDQNPLEGFPDLPPDNTEDVLANIQGDFNYLQIPFGFKYKVFPKRYFYPYVGLGLIAGKSTRSRLEYEYESASLGDYAKSKGKLLPRTFDLSAFWSSLGFQVQLNRNWSLIVEGSSQVDLKKGDYKFEDLQILKMSTGFQYKF